MPSNGFIALQAATSLKVNNANDEALHGADKQKDLVNKQKLLRQAQQAMDGYVSSDGAFTPEEQQKIANTINFLKSQGVDIDHPQYGIYSHGQYDDSSNSQHQNNKRIIDGIKSTLDGVMKELEAQDRLGNFEIQRLMSTYNQQEQLTSSVQKKLDDTANAIIGKVG